MLVKDIRDPSVAAFNVLSIRFSDRVWTTVSYEIHYNDNRVKAKALPCGKNHIKISWIAL